MRALVVVVVGVVVAGLAASGGACGDDSLEGGVDGVADGADGLAADAASDSTSLSNDADASTETITDAVPGDSTSGPDTADSAVASDVSDDADAGPFGGDRPAKVVLPIDYDPTKPWPLVMLLHGYGASGELQDLYLGFSDTASQKGFITIVPEGTKEGETQYWNASPGWCCDFGHRGVDDDGYLVGLVADAKTRWNIDPAQVFVFGHSNGGFMAHELACHHADLFAAITSLAGSLPMGVNDCNPSEPVSVLQIHGTLDAVIVYPGNNDYPGAEAIVDRWASYDECSDTPVEGDKRDYDSTVLGDETTPLTYGGCDAHANVVLWRMDGGSHLPIVSGGSMISDALDWLSDHPKQQR